MPESFASSEDLGFVALGLRAGGSIWLAAASIYAVEVGVGEDFSTVKTMGEVVGVMESPKQIFDAIAALQVAVDAREVEKFVKHVTDNHIQVDIFPDDAIGLVESDPRAKAIRWRDRVQSTTDDLADDTLRAAGFSEDSIAGARERRAAEAFASEMDTEFGNDLNDSLDEARRRAEGEGNTGA